MGSSSLTKASSARNIWTGTHTPSYVGIFLTVPIAMPAIVCLHSDEVCTGFVRFLSHEIRLFSLRGDAIQRRTVLEQLKRDVGRDRWLECRTK